MASPISDSERVDYATELRIAVMFLARRLRAERHVNGISPLAVAVLVRLHRQPGLTPRALAGAEHAAPQTLTRVLATLEERGLVTRLPDPADGRRSLLQITAEGRRVLKQDSTARDRWLADLMEKRLSRAELELLRYSSQLLTRLAEED